ncbi:MAG: RluA family pseudouridine synthase [Abyssibacter sp.]|uniref:RluA family pseudouridine synthase n=1 Tax=Abyssibacter sp. TaxID=2320200 RepID=UPI00321AE5A6
MPQNSPKVRYHAVTAAEDGQRIDNLLLGQLKGVPRSHVYRLLSSGQVRRNGGRVKPSTRVATGDQVRIPPVRTAERDAGPPPDRLVHRVREAIIDVDGDFIVLDKPEGIAVHGGSGVPHGVIECLRVSHGQDYDLVHRLDRETSGVLVCARRGEPLRRARQALNHPKTEKHYQVLVHGRWRGGLRTVDASLDVHARQGGERTVRADEGGKRAVTHFDALDRRPQMSLLEAQIDTGRTHQIRVHAASIGYPVVGDLKYGDADRDAQVEPGRLCLHAWRMRLVHREAGKLLEISASVPDAFLSLLDGAT